MMYHYMYRWYIYSSWHYHLEQHHHDSCQESTVRTACSVTQDAGNAFKAAATSRVLRKAALVSRIVYIIQEQVMKYIYIYIYIYIYWRGTSNTIAILFKSIHSTYIYIWPSRNCFQGVMTWRLSSLLNHVWRACMKSHPYLYPDHRFVPRIIIMMIMIMC